MVEEIVKNSISISIFAIGILWILFQIRYIKDQEVRQRIEKLVEQYKKLYPNGIIVPSAFTLISPFFLLPFLQQSKTEDFSPGLIPFIVPVLSFFLGQLSVTQQKNIVREETNKKLVLEIFGEVLHDIRVLRSNKEKLIIESAHIKNNKYRFIRLTFLRKVSLENTLRDSPEFLMQKGMFIDTRPIIYLIDEINELILARQNFLLSLTANIQENGIAAYDTELKAFSLNLIDYGDQLEGLLFQHFEKINLTGQKID